MFEVFLLDTGRLRGFARWVVDATMNFLKKGGRIKVYCRYLRYRRIII